MRIRTPDSGAATAVSAPPVVAPPLREDWPGVALLDDPVTADVLFRVWSGDPAVVVPSPPGSGKTRLTVLLAEALAHRVGLRVAVVAQTRAQAVQIGHRLAERSSGLARLVMTRRAGDEAPELPVASGRTVAWPGSGGAIRVATMGRWLFADAESMRADVLLVDEAWQCTYGDLGAVACMASQVVLVGDPGQIAPVVTGSVRRWDDSPVGPHVPAPEGLRAQHGDVVATVRLRHTWRLGPVTTRLVSGAFYSDLPFTSRRPAEHVCDASGAEVPEMVHQVVGTTSGPGDPALALAAAERVRALLAGRCVVGSEVRPMTAQDVAVIVPHVAQASQVRAMLAVDAPGVLVGTANALQGLERRAVVAYHPLVGRREVTEFATDAGRACVTLTRHRAHVTVVCDPASPELSDAEDRQSRTLGAVTASIWDSPEV